MPHAVIIGAGVVGCACAWRLAQRGFTVTVLERARVGEEGASSAAAGMLGAQIEAHPVPAMQALCVESRDMFPEFVGELVAASGMAVELRRTGALRVAYDAATTARLAADVALQRGRGLTAATLSQAEVARLEPRLAAVAAAAFFEGDGVVEPRALLAATRVAAERAGATFVEDCEVRGLVFEGGDVTGVDDVRGERFDADQVVIAAGSWSTRLAGIERLGLARDEVEPVRGQMIELMVEPPWLGPLVEGPVAYLSGRADGRLLVGSTLERVGFVRAVTAGALARLLSEAVRMVPELEHAAVSRTWCGFRAAASDGFPILDRVGQVIIATGHYRNGVVLTPLTAEVVVALALGEPAPVDLTPFAARRLTAAPTSRQEAPLGHVS